MSVTPLDANASSGCTGDTLSPREPEPHDGAADVPSHCHSKPIGDSPVEGGDASQEGGAPAGASPGGLSKDGPEPRTPAAPLDAPGNEGDMPHGNSRLAVGGNPSVRLVRRAVVQQHARPERNGGTHSSIGLVPSARFGLSGPWDTVARAGVLHAITGVPHEAPSASSNAAPASKAGELLFQLEKDKKFHLYFSDRDVARVEIDADLGKPVVQFNDGAAACSEHACYELGGITAASATRADDMTRSRAVNGSACDDADGDRADGAAACSEQVRHTQSEAATCGEHATKSEAARCGEARNAVEHVMSAQQLDCAAQQSAAAGAGDTDHSAERSTEVRSCLLFGIDYVA